MNKNLIFTNGCFDVLHYGHFKILEYCRELAGNEGKVVVGLNSDSSVKALKGSARPFNNEKTRKFALESIKYVDEVIVFSEETPVKLIKKIKPSIIVKGGDYDPKNVVGNDLAQVKIFEYVNNCSTTKVLDEILKNP